MSNTVLNRAVEKFRQNLTDEQRQLFTASSLEKVNAEIQSIQDRHGSRKQLRSLSRISKFLEAMTQIEQLAQIFLNVSEVVAFVWVMIVTPQAKFPSHLIADASYSIGTDQTGPHGMNPRFVLLATPLINYNYHRWQARGFKHWSYCWIPTRKLER